jgi:hypothetical protein
MRNFLKTFFALGALMLVSSQAIAALPNQLVRIEPAAGSDFDHGPYSTQEQGVANDPDRAIAFDNFTLGSTYNITGIDWVGLYAEPLPGFGGAPGVSQDTDFVVKIWGDASGVPDIGSGALHTFNLEGGPIAGTGGPDLSVVPNGDVSSATSTSVGGGPGFSYGGAIIPPTLLAAGDYWISVVADQVFGNASPIFDPEWQWHRGTGPGDGFYAADFTLDPAGTPAYGILQPDKDLAFALRGRIVPEPSGMLMAIFGLTAVGLIRRKRK